MSVLKKMYALSRQDRRSNDDILKEFYIENVLPKSWNLTDCCILVMWLTSKMTASLTYCYMVTHMAIELQLDQSPCC